MTSRPSRETVEGRAYLDLQNLARRTGRPTDELHQLYALEGFLDRLTRSRHAENFVLKGGVLLAAYETRRPTRDIDLSASAVDNEIETVQHVVSDVLAIEVDDGLAFDGAGTTAELIRGGARYSEDDRESGVRVHAGGRLASARLRFHVDVNIGDPITPPPVMVTLPRLLGGDLEVRGYPIEMVLAEKILTAVELGTANSRWRDFVDLAALVSVQQIDGDELSASIASVARHRGIDVLPLAEVLDDYPIYAQDRWRAWRTKNQLEATTGDYVVASIGGRSAVCGPGLSVLEQLVVDPGDRSVTDELANGLELSSSVLSEGSQLDVGEGRQAEA